MSFSIRTAISGTITAVALFTSAHAFAAGTVTVTQQSPTGFYGDYSVTLPDGTKVPSYDQQTRLIDPAQAGTYTLSITPPSDAHLLVTVIQNGVEQSATVSRTVTFTHHDGDETLVTVQYRYAGSIVVDSDPQGAHFELLGPNDMRDSGITPAVYTNVAPGTYRVTFFKQEGCNLISPIQRSLGANQTLLINGKFVCGVPLPPPPAPVESEEPVADVNEGRTLRIWAVPQQAEVLPDGTPRVTITVKNTGTRTVHDLVVSAQADAAQLQMISPLPHLGTMENATAVWRVPQLYAGKIWTVTIPVSVDADVRQGDRLEMTARVSGADLQEGTNDTLVATARIGVTTLPETGWGFDLAFVTVSLAAAAVLAKRTVRRLV